MKITKIVLNLSYEEIKTDLIKFSQVITQTNKYYPLVFGVMPGLARLQKQNGSYVNISTNSIMLEEVAEKEAIKSLKHIIEIIKGICQKFKILKFSQTEIQFIGTTKAVSTKWQRPLLKGLSSELPPEIINKIEIEDYKFGNRVYYSRNKQKYAFIIEPFLQDSKYNIFTLRVTIPEKTNTDKIFKLMVENLNYVSKNISSIMEE